MLYNHLINNAYKSPIVLARLAALIVGLLDFALSSADLVAIARVSWFPRKPLSHSAIDWRTARWTIWLFWASGYPGFC